MYYNPVRCDQFMVPIYVPVKQNYIGYKIYSKAFFVYCNWVLLEIDICMYTKGNEKNTVFTRLMPPPNKRRSEVLKIQRSPRRSNK